MLVMARYMSPEELGIFGLLSVTIGMAILFLGMNFNAFNAREILARPMGDIPLLIRDQGVFHGLMYVLVMPLLLLVFTAGFIPWTYLGWFYTLLVLGHISEEIYVLFITLSRPVTANIVLFVRFGAWAYAVSLAGVFMESARNLEVLLLCWVAGELISLIIAAICLKDLPWKRIQTNQVNWLWIRYGFKTSIFFS